MLKWVETAKGIWSPQTVGQLGTCGLGNAVVCLKKGESAIVCLFYSELTDPWVKGAKAMIKGLWGSLLDS